MTEYYVESSGPLGRLFPEHKIPINGENLKSIEQSLWYLLLMLHGKEQEAKSLATHPGFQHSAVRIHPYISSLHFLVKAEWAFQIDRIYYAIILLLLDQKTQFYQIFVQISQEYPNEEISFILTSAKKELVWSIGLRKNSAMSRQGIEYGLNVYGKLLSRAYESWKLGLYQAKMQVSHLVQKLHDIAESNSRTVCASSKGQLSVSATGHTSAESNSRTVCVSSKGRVSVSADSDNSAESHFRTVLLLSDSQCRHVQSIYNGKVVAIGGAKYHTLAEHVEKQNIRLADYRRIIIFCGVNNCRFNDRKLWRSSWKHLERLLRPILSDDSPLQVIINSPIRNPKAKFVKEHSIWLRNEISAIPNVTFCDWSSDTDNVFIKKDKSINEHLHDSGRFHINVAGTRELWKGWIGIWPELRLMDLKVSQEIYTPAPSPAAKMKKRW